MKKNKLMAAAAITLFMAACSPKEKRTDLPAIINKSQLSFSVTQKSGHDNILYLQSNTKGVIPYWDYAEGVSTRVNDTVSLPFSGDYYIKYGANSPGGLVMDSTKITVSKTDLSLIADPEWGLIAGSTPQGKTWVLDMTAPIGWFGFDYGKPSGDNWDWHPSYAGNEWVMPNRDYGEMTFDLNGSKNYSRSLKNETGQVTKCTGKFSIDPVKKMVYLIGCEVLFGGDYYKNSSNWSELKILKLTETSMILAVIRDKPNPGDSPCYIGFNFKLK
ncbi:hypothetical protein [Filimonas effusa]|uniref:PKD domain-containing protein n=1 Tax=Filimonas effusa TaxID=2508721 RepID=A0A4Q1D7R4_9BACT|nr:hypothetical protein [Filimonas effusa]RXK83801.1 hypothetical protein ESB13_17165 [Filimonas effusa]